MNSSPLKGGQLTRFDHNNVPCRHGCWGLHRDRHDRGVPGDDESDYTVWLGQRVAQLTVLQRAARHVTADLVGPPGVVTGPFRRELRERCAGARRAPIISSAQTRDLIGVLLHQISELQQKLPPVGWGRPSPSGERRMSMLHSIVNGARVSQWDSRVDFTGCRVDVLPKLARSGHQLLAVDPQMDLGEICMRARSGVCTIPTRLFLQTRHFTSFFDRCSFDLRDGMRRVVSD
jgi:hypothetical protein